MPQLFYRSISLENRNWHAKDNSEGEAEIHFTIFSLWKEFLKYHWSEVKVTQLCPTLCDPVDYTLHGILQARILGWVTFPFSRGSSQTRNRTQVSGLAGGFFTSWATREVLGQYIFAEGRGSCVCYFILTSQTNSNVPFNFFTTLEDWHLKIQH